MLSILHCVDSSKILLILTIDYFTLGGAQRSLKAPHWMWLLVLWDWRLFWLMNWIRYTDYGGTNGCRCRFLKFVFTLLFCLFRFGFIWVLCLLLRWLCCVSVCSCCSLGSDGSLLSSVSPSPVSVLLSNMIPFHSDGFSLLLIILCSLSSSRSPR